MRSNPMRTRDHDEPPIHRAVRLGATAAVGVVALAAILFASVPLKIAGVLFALCVLQGLWRGASELAGLLVGSVLAIALAPPIARGVEAPIGAAFGTTGLVNRFAAIALIGGVIIIAVGSVGGVVARRLMRDRPHWRRWDRYLGGAFGVVEGLVLGLMVLWVPLALEPIAESRLARTEWDDYAQTDSPPAPPPPGARAVLRMAREVRESVLGGVAQATNPVPGSDLLALAADFAAVSRDPAAMDHLMSSPVMEEIQAMPSVVKSLELMRADDEVRAVIEGGRGVTADFLRTLVTSPTVLRVFDETTVVDDLTPQAERLRRAIREAKAVIAAAPPPR